MTLTVVEVGHVVQEHVSSAPQTVIVVVSTFVLQECVMYVQSMPIVLLLLTFVMRVGVSSASQTVIVVVSTFVEVTARVERVLMMDSVTIQNIIAI